jgi:hypothetical protein
MILREILPSLPGGNSVVKVENDMNQAYRHTLANAAGSAECPFVLGCCMAKGRAPVDDLDADLDAAQSEESMNPSMRSSAPS